MIIYSENRELHQSVSISWDIAHHLYMRQRQGCTALVIVQSPSSMLASIRKQWLKIVMKLQRERSSTLQHRRSIELQGDIQRMLSVRFKVGAQPVNQACDVLIICPSDIANLADRLFNTVYVACPIDEEVLEQAIVTTLRNGLLVKYGGFA